MKKVLRFLFAFSIMFLMLSTVVLASSPTLEPKYFEEKCGFINQKGQIVIEPKFDRLGRMVDGLTPARIGEKEGYIDEQGEFVIKAEYTFADDFSEEGLARVNVDGVFEGGQFPVGGKWGFIDSTGEYVVKAQYDWVESFSDGLAKVILNGKTQYINIYGQVTLNCYYPSSGNFSEGYTWVLDQKGEYSYMNLVGQLPFKNRWTSLPGQFSEGLASVSFKGKDGYVDTWMNIVIPHRYDIGCEFINGLARVRNDGKWGFIDSNGAIIVPLEYDFAENYSEGFALVRLGGKVGYINTTGQIVITPQYDDGASFSDGLAAVYIKGQGWGFINTGGKMVIQPSMAEVCDFSNGLAQFFTASGWGYVDAGGFMRIPPQYDDAFAFEQTGLAKVVIDGRFGFIDHTGRMVIPAQLSKVSGWVDGVMAAIPEDEWIHSDLTFYQVDGAVNKTFLGLLQENQAKDTFLLKDTYSVMTLSGINMRKTADIKGEKIKTIPYGAEVKIVEQTTSALTVEGIAGFWAKVDYNGVQGYVFDGFLTRLPAPNLEEEFWFDSYMENRMSDQQIFHISSLIEDEYIIFKQSNAGIVSIEAGNYQWEAWSLQFYIPGVSVREMFLLMRVLNPEVTVTEINGQSVEGEKVLKDVALPDTKDISIYVPGEEGGWVITIEEGPEGYVLVSPY